MPAGRIDHLSHLCFSDFVSVDSTYPNTMLVNVKHYPCRFVPSFIKEPLEDIDDELHRRVVVIQNQNSVQGGLLKLRLDLRDDRRPHPVSLITLLALGHQCLLRIPAADTDLLIR